MQLPPKLLCMPTTRPAHWDALVGGPATAHTPLRPVLTWPLMMRLAPCGLQVCHGLAGRGAPDE